MCKKGVQIKIFRCQFNAPTSQLTKIFFFQEENITIDRTSLASLVGRKRTRLTDTLSGKKRGEYDLLQDSVKPRVSITLRGELEWNYLIRWMI